MNFEQEKNIRAHVRELLHTLDHIAPRWEPTKLLIILAEEYVRDLIPARHDISTLAQRRRRLFSLISVAYHTTAKHLTPFPTHAPMRESIREAAKHIEKH